MKNKVKGKSPLMQEKPTYSEMPTSKRSGFKDKPYTATAKDSADYREGFNNPGKLTTNMFKTSGRMEVYKRNKSPLRQDKGPYVPGRVSKEVRDAANANKSANAKTMQTRFENRAAAKGMTTEDFSNYNDKQQSKNDAPMGNPKTFGFQAIGRTGARCPSGANGYQ